MIPVTLSTGSIYTYGTARAFELAARAGYDGLELMIDDRWDTRQAGYLGGLIEQYELPVLSVHSPFSSLRIAGWPSDEVARTEQALTLADDIGARVVNLHLPFRVRDLAIAVARRTWTIPVPGATADQRDYGRWLVDGGLAALQERMDVEIVIENLPMRAILGRRYSPFAMNTWVELGAFPGICLDTTHCGTANADILAIHERLADRIAHVHLSDYSDGRQHLSAGRGSLPLAELLQALAARDFPGTVVVELSPATLPMHDEEELAAELRRNLEFCRRHLEHISNKGSPGF